MSSEEVLVTDQYSTSVDDCATELCFLDDHETGCLPM